MNIESAPVSVVLQNKGIPHRVFVHTGPIRSLSQAAQEREQLPDQIVRSILFRVSKGEYVMVLISGSRQINWKTLRQYLDTNRITLASKDEVIKVTGYQLGAVAPLGLNQPIKILIDRAVLGQSIISIGSGVRGTAIILKSKDLIKALGDCEIHDFAGI